MEVVAKGKYIRMSSRKMGLVVDLIRGKKAVEAVTILRFSNKKAARLVLKVLNSAIANAKNTFDLSEDNLVISKAQADSGPTLKRGRFASRGRSVRILKRTTHITIGLREIKLPKAVGSKRKQAKGEKVSVERTPKKSARKGRIPSTDGASTNKKRRVKKQVEDK